MLRTSAEVEQLARELASEPLLGIDTEADSFHSYFTKVCLVQISTRDRDIIIDPLAAEDLSPLGPLLADPRITCIFHGADYDLRILDRDHGFTVSGLFDTMIAARLLGYKSFGLSSLLERHFDLHIPKQHQRADWSRRPLTADMLRYAATDTHYLPALRDLLLQELTGKGRQEWAAEEFALLQQVRHQPKEDDDAFRRVKGAGTLDRRHLAVLREVWQLRDRKARDLDRAPFRVLGNATLLELARKRPKRPQDLAGIPGMPRSRHPTMEREVLEAVARGVEMPEEDLPKRRLGRGGPREREHDLTRFRAVRDRVAAEQELDPALVAPNALMEAVARAKPASLEDLLTVPGMRRWQAGLLAEGFLEAIKDL